MKGAPSLCGVGTLPLSFLAAASSNPIPKVTLSDKGNLIVVGGEGERGIVGVAQVFDGADHSGSEAVCGVVRVQARGVHVVPFSRCHAIIIPPQGRLSRRER